jgi:hypothetical protein
VEIAVEVDEDVLTPGLDDVVPVLVREVVDEIEEMLVVVDKDTDVEVVVDGLSTQKKPVELALKTLPKELKLTPSITERLTWS